MLQWIIQKRK